MNTRSCQPKKIFAVIVADFLSAEVRVVKRTFCCFSMQIPAPKPEGNNIKTFVWEPFTPYVFLKVGRFNLHDVPTLLQTAHFWVPCEFWGIKNHTLVANALGPDFNLMVGELKDSL